MKSQYDPVDNISKPLSKEKIKRLRQSGPKNPAMTTKTDNYRELAQQAVERSERDERVPIETHNDVKALRNAIDALSKERDALAGDKCICGHSKGLHPTTPHRDGRCERGGCVCLTYMRDDVFADRDTLARENERLSGILTTLVEGDNCTCTTDPHDPIDEFCAINIARAALANAPTPNDKGK